MAAATTKEMDIEMGITDNDKGCCCCCCCMNMSCFSNADAGLRWAFIRKVYAILCMQLLLAFGVSLAMFLVHPVRDFMRTSNGIWVLLGVWAVGFILLILMLCYKETHPWNYIFMFFFTIMMSFMIGVVCAQQKGEILLLAAGLTLVVVIGLTLFTFFAAMRGCDFKFLGPFLFTALLLLIAAGIIRILFPIGSLGNLIIGCVGALVFSGFIIYDTYNLIERFTYDQYIEAAACLFLDILNMFLYILQIFGSSSD